MLLSRHSGGAGYSTQVDVLAVGNTNRSANWRLVLFRVVNAQPLIDGRCIVFNLDRLFLHLARIRLPRPVDLPTGYTGPSHRARPNLRPMIATARPIDFRRAAKLPVGNHQRGVQHSTIREVGASSSRSRTRNPNCTSCERASIKPREMPPRALASKLDLSI